jgi:predicted RNA binding protein YcfA (HicA-like mRNA interferase family)
VRSVSGKKFAQILIRHDWQLRRVNGSHHIFTESGSPARISVPIHGNESEDWPASSSDEAGGHP